MLIEIEGASCTGKTTFIKELKDTIFTDAITFKFPSSQPDKELTPQEYQDYCY